MRRQRAPVGRNLQKSDLGEDALPSAASDFGAYAELEERIDRTVCGRRR